MIHINKDKNDTKLITQLIEDYNDGDTEMSLPEAVVKLDKSILLYIISRLLAQ